MVPTAKYNLFETAETLGQTVAGLLLGGSQPISNMELYLWGRFRLARERIRQQQRGPGKSAF